MTLAVLALVVVAPAGAQTPPPTTTPTTAPDLLGGLLQQLLPTTTTVAPAPSTAPPSAPGNAAKAANPGNTGASPGPTTTTTSPPGVIPPEYLPIINSVHRTGSRTTSALIDALRPLQDLGFTAQDAAIAGFGHFPVAGPADWSDNWLEPRFTPTFHLHQGDDIFAARGTPVRAPFAGVVRFAREDAGGNAAYVTVPDGTYYYMCHLDSFSTKISSGSAVKQGDVVGFTGDTGDATPGATHVHFEIHPGGGAAIDPSAILDGWISDAINGAAALLVANNAGASRAITGAGVLRSFEDQSPSPSGRVVGPLLWASSQSAGGGTLRLAELQVARLAGRIDWDRHTSEAQAQADALQAGRTVAVDVLGPVTPPALMPLVRGGS